MDRFDIFMGVMIAGTVAAVYVWCVALTSVLAEALRWFRNLR